MFCIPAQCPKCHAIFASPFAMDQISQITINDCLTDYLVCSTLSPVASGTFPAIDGIIKMLSEDQLTSEMVCAFQGVLSEAARGHISAEAAVRKAKKIDRRLGTALKVTQKFGLPGVTLLVGIVGAYVAPADSESTSELSEGMFAEMRRQTEMMQTIAPPHTRQMPRVARLPQRAIQQGKPRTR